MTNPDDLVTISAFARRVGLTPSALRFYDECGLLTPHHVQPDTGYRFYAADQEPRARLLRHLRETDLPLADARLVLDGPATEAARVLRAHLRTMQDKLEPARRAAAFVLGSLAGDSEACEVRLSGPELASSVRQVGYAVGSLEEFPGLAGILLEISDSAVTLVATDRHRLAIRVLTPRGFEGTARQLLVPGAELAELTQAATRYDDVVITADSRGATLSAGGHEQPLTSLEAEFPDYRTILDGLEPAPIRSIVDRARLLDVLVNGDLPAVVALTVGSDRLTVATPGGTDDIYVDATCTGPDLRLGFATALLGEALAVSVGPDVMLEFTAANRPVVIRSADQGTFTTMAMPTLLDQVA
jgi:DNA-binding transcriptional MerR regulator